MSAVTFVRPVDMGTVNTSSTKRGESSLSVSPPRSTPERVGGGFTYVPPPRSAQIALATILVVLAGLLVFRGYGNHIGMQPTEHITVARVDLNQADRAHLAQIPNLGPKLAERIDDHRAKKGPFRSVEELQDVHGIGPKILEKIRPYVQVGAPPARTVGVATGESDPQIPHRNQFVSPAERPAHLAPSPAARVTGLRKLQPGDPPVNVNTASASELQQIPSVGPVTAGNIISARADRPFHSVDELDRVRGIGPKTLAKIRPFVVVE